MRLLDSSSKTEAGRIESLRKDIHDLQEKIREKNFNYRCRCQDLLSPEQKIPFHLSALAGDVVWKGMEIESIDE